MSLQLYQETKNVSLAENLSMSCNNWTYFRQMHLTDFLVVEQAKNVAYLALIVLL